MGLPNGKTEAWYILSAAPEAKVALGLSRRLTPQQLRKAIDDGSISDLVVWHTVSADDVIIVPAGTIHAIGSGLVIAELQQRSDTTFRLFDPGRNRELHVENAIMVADAGPAEFQARSSRLNPERRLLVSTAHSYSNGSIWSQIPLGVWKRNGRLGFLFSAAALTPDRSKFHRATPFLRNRTVSTFTLAPIGMVGLVAYTGGGGTIPHLLQRIARRHRSMPGGSNEIQVPTSLNSSKGCAEEWPPGTN